jgi:hypothetical protein
MAYSWEPGISDLLEEAKTEQSVDLEPDVLRILLRWPNGRLVVRQEGALDIIIVQPSS